MPRTTEEAVGSVKRKRLSSVKRISKRARSESSEEDDLAQILLLENEIFESKKNYNNIATLIRIFEASDDHRGSLNTAAISLCRVFTRVMVLGDMTNKRNATEKDVIVIRWLKERYSQYKMKLVSLLADEEISLTALTLCMRLLKTEGQHIRGGCDYIFPATFLTNIVRVLMHAEGMGARKEFSEKFVEEYDDIRFYALEAVEKLLGEDILPISRNQIFDHALEILSSIESVPESEEELEDFYITEPAPKTHVLYSLNQHKKRAQAAWLTLMHFDMDKNQKKSILKLMTESIAPWFLKPELLMDFLTDAYNAGGSTSLLALSGVFYLIQEKNLDYPSFYKKLYSLLDAEILHSKHRSRFFRLLDIFLGSTHLPAVLVASFLKRLSRLTLGAPPSAVVAVVPWIYNMMKKHPACTFMIHRETRETDIQKKLMKEGMEDPFLIDEEDPMNTYAVDSSLWEIVTLQAHYHPNVATLAKIISEQFTKNLYNMEDFLDHSYGSMLEAELAKDVKKVPVVEFEIPKRIFMVQEADSGAENSSLVKLWEF